MSIQSSAELRRKELLAQRDNIDRLLAVTSWQLLSAAIQSTFELADEIAQKCPGAEVLGNFETLDVSLPSLWRADDGATWELDTSTVHVPFEQLLDALDQFPEHFHPNWWIAVQSITNASLHLLLRLETEHLMVTAHLSAAIPQSYTNLLIDLGKIEVETTSTTHTNLVC